MTTTQESKIKTFADAEKVLASRLPGYTERPQQQALAAAVEEAIATGQHLLAQAGCGTGKSLATAIPAILSGKRTVIATATIALMEQYANKDMPFLEENLGVDFTWTLLKGRSNYLCLAKAQDANPAFVPVEALMKEIHENPDHTGDREHFTTPVTKEQFSNVAMSGGECPGKRNCAFGAQCFSEAAKEKAKHSDVIVTNTAMLLADLKVREVTGGQVSMLSDYEMVLIDEAHETEEYATGALEADVRKSGVVKMITEAETFAGRQGVSLSTSAALQDVVLTAWETLDPFVPSATKGDKPRVGLAYFVENADAWMGLFDALREFSDEVASISVNSVDSDSKKKAETQRNRMVRRALNYADTISMAVSTDEDLLVRWVEIWTPSKGRGESQVILKTAPVHVGSYLAEWLWDRVPAVLLSATLIVGGEFTYMKDRLGLPEETLSVNVGTPFDYDRQALLYTPEGSAPSPKDRNRWLGWAGLTMGQLIEASNGGALMLFTSRDAMEQAYETLSVTLDGKGINCYMQGKDGSNKEIAARFTEDTHSVLFALKSFFTGVDFQGDTCRLVVIDKMPFAAPNDPILAARTEQIDRWGGNSFTDLTIPMMTLVLEQGYGRAIRTVHDRATIAILDSRLNAGWAGKIVRGLPQSPRTSNLDTVRAFYRKGE